jgi:chromate reductase, NAD(P)H dehydrogenase (quinone)
VKILGISGSLRRDSHNSALLRIASRLAPEHVSVTIFEGLAAIPAFNDDSVELPPAAVREMWARFAAADGVLVATPEYNSSMPGALKNALDWLSRPLEDSPLRNKPVVVIGASTGMFGAVWAQAEARKVLNAIGARVVDIDLAISEVHEKLAGADALTDAETERRIIDAIGGLERAISARAEMVAATRP